MLLRNGMLTNVGNSGPSWRLGLAGALICLMVCLPTAAAIAATPDELLRDARQATAGGRQRDAIRLYMTIVRDHPASPASATALDAIEGLEASANEWDLLHEFYSDMLREQALDRYKARKIANGFLRAHRARDLALGHAEKVLEEHAASASGPKREGIQDALVILRGAAWAAVERTKTQAKAHQEWLASEERVLRGEPAQQKALPSVEDMLRVWREKPFVPIEDTEAFRGQVEGMVKKAKGVLDERQRSQLVSAISNLILIYGTGDFQRYLDFMARGAGTRPNTVMEDAARQMIPKSTHPELKGMALPKDFGELEKALWQKFYPVAPWLAIAFEGTEVEVFQSELPAWLSRRIAQSGKAIFGWGIRAGGMRTYNVTLEAMVKAAGRITYADVEFVVKHAEPDPPYPHRLLFRWDPLNHIWILVESASYYAGQRRYELFF